MRIGPAMLRAQAYVAAHPGKPLTAVGREIGPNGSEFYGVRAVRRAADAGIVILRPPEGPRGIRRVDPVAAP